MGQSTDAILFYGYCWTEETRRPWTIARDDESTEGDDVDWEERYAKALGEDAPTEPYPETRDRRGHQRADLTAEEQAVVAKYSAYWDRQRDLTRGRIPGWPPFAGPGWLAAYSLGLLCWLAIKELWGGVIVVSMIAGGFFGTIAVVEWLGETNRPRAPTPPEDRR